MSLAPDLQRHEIVAKRAGEQRHDREEDHHGAVHGHELVVELGQHVAAGRVGLADDCSHAGGSGDVGHASCQRIRSMSRNPTSRNPVAAAA